MLSRSPLLALNRSLRPKSSLQGVSLRLFVVSSQSSLLQFASITQHSPLSIVGHGHGLRQLSSWSKQSRTPYEVLGVTKTATDKEIKLAYFREAKKWHPDVNPNDSQAKQKFQEVAAAYELLRDPKRRAEFDMNASSYQQSADWHQSTNYAQTNANDIFKSVLDDAEVVKDALKMYVAELYDDIDYAVEVAKNGDWTELRRIAQDNMTFILGLLLPIIVITRYPAAAFVVLRYGIVALETVMSALIMRGQVGIAIRWIWSNIVKLALDKKRNPKKTYRKP